MCKGENVSVTFTNSLNEAVVVTIGGQEYEIVGTHTFSARIKYANAPVCEQTLNSVQVVVNANPTAQISGTGDYCTGESVLLLITLTGKAPYTLVYKENQTEKTIQISQNRHNSQITPTANVTFTLISVTDANGCSSALSGATASATIRIKEGMSVTITTDKNRYSLGSKNGVFVVSGKRGGKIFYRITGTNLLQEATFATNTLQIPIPTNKVGEKTLMIERTEYLGCSVEVSVAKTIKVTGAGFLNPTLRFRSGK